MKNKTVLIIDDDARNIFALDLILRSKGYKCITANGAMSGIDKLKENKEIGIVLMDMMMPEMDGYEAMTYIRKNLGLIRTPIIAVTAQAMSGDRERCLLSGASAYISKPINTDLLLKLLEELETPNDGIVNQ